MTRLFNTGGPNKPPQHYSIDPFARVNWRELRMLIDAERYFVLHAPRQTGKTTLLNAIVERLNAEGTYEALYVNVEGAQVARNDARWGDELITAELLEMASVLVPKSWLARERKQLAMDTVPGSRLRQVLAEWAQHSEKPTVLMIDEIDSLVGDTLVFVLRQLRAGFNVRPAAFPQSIILCGVRDVRDYRIHTSTGEIIAGGSCFNVKVESLRLGNFSEEEVRALYGQHTCETGQVFEEPVFPKTMLLTRGQPWLVNALARELTEKVQALQDRTRSITLDDLEDARETLIRRRDTHLDQLVDKLKEPRVRRVVEPILMGGTLSGSATEEDRQYVVDLGLVVEDVHEGTCIANEIYREIIPRVLTSTFQQDLVRRVPTGAYVLPDGRLDFRGMLAGFQQFYRENADILGDSLLYGEATPHLMLQGWLQRVVNSGGRIERNYALGTGSADIFVRHYHRECGKRVEERFVVEVKAVRSHSSVETTVEDGLGQTAQYADRCNPRESHLVVVDRHKRSWEEKIYVKECVGRVPGRAGGKGWPITVWGM